MATVSPITDVLRRAVLDSGLPLLRIANETGVQRASLSRFVRGKNSLRLDVADKLAAYFGLELTKTEQATAKPKGVTDGQRLQEANDRVEAEREESPAADAGRGEGENRVG